MAATCSRCLDHWQKERPVTLIGCQRLAVVSKDRMVSKDMGELHPRDPGQPWKQLLLMVLSEFVAYESNAKVKHLGLIQCLGNIFLDPKGTLLPMYPLKEFRLRHLGKEWVNHSWKLLGIESQGRNWD